MFVEVRGEEDVEWSFGNEFLLFDVSAWLRVWAFAWICRADAKGTRWQTAGTTDAEGAGDGR